MRVVVHTKEWHQPLVYIIVLQVYGNDKTTGESEEIPSIFMGIGFVNSLQCHVLLTFIWTYSSAKSPCDFTLLQYINQIL